MSFLIIFFIKIVLNLNNYTAIPPGKTFCKGVANYKKEDYTFFIESFEENPKGIFFFVENNRKT